jgi:hypothetical protein|tara:strand:- start:496 stop:690 length:195 start_codon:yes stop_codon:yes gene_type:complete
MADPTTFGYKVLKAIQNRVSLTQDSILHGSPKDMESYKLLVGELRGLEFAEQEIKEILQSPEDE